MYTTRENRIREIRKAKQMTQVELARLAKVSQPHIHDLENGYRRASPEALERIATALDVTVDELIKRTEPEDDALGVTVQELRGEGETA